MIRIREFIKSGGSLTDPELFAMIRERTAMMQTPEKRDWAQQVELVLDGYGGEAQRAAAERVHEALKQIEVEMKLSAPASE